MSYKPVSMKSSSKGIFTSFLFVEDLSLLNKHFSGFNKSPVTNQVLSLSFLDTFWEDVLKKHNKH